MQPLDVVNIVRRAVEDVKENNQEMVSVDALLKYLQSLSENVGKSQEDAKRNLEANLTLFRAEHERNLAHYQAEQTHAVELFRSVITYGSAAMKSALLINGGAAVALLAFIGNIWTKNITSDAANSITASILLFSFGVLAAAIGTAGSYFSQYCYSEPFPRAAIVFHTVTVLLVLGSYVLFGFGTFEAYSAFASHLGL